MREWEAEPEPSTRGLDEFFSQLFSHGMAPAADRAAEREREPGQGDHPPEEMLRSYVAGELAPDWPGPEEMRTAWGYRRISVHVLRCGRCRERLRTLPSASTSSPRRKGFRWLQRWLQEAAQPVPRPALATIAIQSLVIIGLVGLLLWQPEPIFRSASTADALSARSFPASPPEGGLPSSPSPASPGPAGEPLAGAETEEASYPPEVLQAIRTVQTVSDPAQRLNALKLLQHYPDPLLVEDLSQLYERETHPQVREEMARTIWVILSRTDRGLSGAVRFFEQLRRQAPDRPWFQKLQQEFAEMQKRLAEGLQIRIEVHPQRMLRCTARRPLTLEELVQIASDLDGTIVLDRSLSPRHFQVHLPASALSAEALQRLEGFGVVCRE